MSRIPEGSVSWSELKSWAEWAFERRGIPHPLIAQLDPSWSAKVQGRMYPELWLRYYAIMRHDHSCMACCSDYANQETGEKLPIVRSRKLDLELLLAHAQVQCWLANRKQQTKKGQNNGRTRSNRTVTKAVAGR